MDYKHPWIKIYRQLREQWLSREHVNTISQHFWAWLKELFLEIEEIFDTYWENPIFQNYLDDNFENTLGNVSNCVKLFVNWLIDFPLLQQEIDSKLSYSKKIAILSINQYIDNLTKAFNRHILKYLEEQEEKLNKRYSIVMIDLNNLKVINDKFWHKAGDLYIKSFWKFLIKNIRAKFDIDAEDWNWKYHDYVIRYWWDEFCVVIDSVDEKVVEQICSRFSTSEFLEYFREKLVLDWAFSKEKIDLIINWAGFCLWSAIWSIDRNLSDTICLADKTLINLKDINRSKRSLA